MKQAKMKQGFVVDSHERIDVNETAAERAPAQSYRNWGSILPARSVPLWSEGDAVETRGHCAIRFSDVLVGQADDKYATAGATTNSSRNSPYSRSYSYIYSPGELFGNYDFGPLNVGKKMTPYGLYGEYRFSQYRAVVVSSKGRSH